MKLSVNNEEKYQYQRVQIATEFMQYIPVRHWYCNNKHDHEK